MGAPTRILLNGWFWDQETTGSGQYVRQLAAHLSHMAPIVQWGLATPRALAASAPPGWQVLIAPPPAPLRHPDLAKLWFEQAAFPLLCRRWRADLAHVPYWAGPLWTPCPVVVTIHDVIPLLLPAYRGGPLPRAYTWLVSRTARRARLVLTDSQASRADIVRCLGLPPEQVRVTPLAAGPHFARVSDATQLAVVRARYRLPARFILYMGGFDVRKNVGALLHAFARARQQRTLPPDVLLVIAGRLPAHDSPFTPDPRALATSLGIGAQVVCCGWVEEMDKPALYSLAEAFVFPSLYEGFGLPLLESLACAG